MVITDSPMLGRTIWAAVGDPDETVVTTLAGDFAGLGPKQSVDEQNGFAPIWSILRSKSFSAVARQARRADQIVLAHRDEWAAALTMETLRGAGVVCPISRVVLDDLRTEQIVQALDRPVEIDRRKVERSWRQKIADKVLDDHIGKPLRRLLGIDWQLTVSGLSLLQRVIWCAAEDQQGDAPLGIDTTIPTVLGALARGSRRAAPETVWADIVALCDLGLVGQSILCAESVAQWCADNKIPTTRMPNQLPPSMGLYDHMLIPTDAQYDMQLVLPAFRETYVDIWKHATHHYAGQFPVDIAAPEGRWRGEAVSLLRPNPPQIVETLAALRAAGLVFGRTYLAPTDMGILADTTIRASWPTIDFDFTNWVMLRVGDPDVPRVDAVGAIACAGNAVRGPSLPEPATLCPQCRGLLRVSYQHSRLRLLCQNTACARAWPAEQLGPMLCPQLRTSGPRWCQDCGITEHDICVDDQTQATRRTCKQCQRSQTF